MSIVCSTADSADAVVFRSDAALSTLNELFVQKVHGAGNANLPE